MRLCIITCMRDALPFLPLYREQLRRWTLQPAVIVVGENGSDDGTRAWLDRWAIDDDARVDAFSFDPPPGPKLERVATAERAAHMARVWNTCLERALEHDWTHAVVMSIQKYAPASVIARLAALDRDIVAPLIMFPMGATRIFYDTWCFQALDGTRFSAHEPSGDSVEEVAGVGGCYLVRRAVYEAGCRLAPTDGTFCESVAFCEQARARGFQVWVDRREPTAWAYWTPGPYRARLATDG